MQCINLIGSVAANGFYSRKASGRSTNSDLIPSLFVLGSPEAGDSILFSLPVCPPYQDEIFNFLIISGTQVYHLRPFVL